MVVTVLGIVMSINEVQPENELVGTTDTLDDHTTVVSEVQP